MTVEFRPLTRENVAEVLGISVRTVENWVSDGILIAPGRLGQRVYWHPRHFYAWLDRALAGADGDPPASVSTSAEGKPEPRRTDASDASKAARSESRDRGTLRARDRAKLKTLLR